MQNQIQRLCLVFFSAIFFFQTAYPQSSTGGMGVLIQIDQGSKYPYIYEVIKGMVADRMSLSRNDLIVSIDGRSTYNYTMEKATAALRGPIGTSCNISIVRNGETYNLTFTREALPEGALTVNPSCYSNAHGWTITKIERHADKTLVYLNLYSHKTEKFFFHDRMYIENYNNQSESKIYVRSAQSDKLNSWYTLDPRTSYNFVLEFDKIPDNWTDINIVEPFSSYKTGWYWNYISLNRSSAERLKIDRFFMNKALSFLGASAHPLDSHLYSKYTINYNEILVTLFFNDGYYTFLRIKKDGNFLTFSQDQVSDYNCDLCPAFLSLYALKEAALDEDNYDEEKSKVERYIGKVLSDMDGCNVASLVLTLMWLGYE